MSSAVDSATRRVMVNGAEIEVCRKGRGSPILFLHPHLGLRGANTFLDRLAEQCEVIAPSHPGFGHSALPPGVGTVDDLAYFYLDMIEQLGLDEFGLVAASFGGWLALELATKITVKLKFLVLIDSLGVKLGDRDKPDFVDIFSLNAQAFEDLAFHSSKFRLTDADALSDDELLVVARNREATARFGWNPYMHNPKLRQRLHRVNVPTLVAWGATDRIAPLAYGEQLAGELPNARFVSIEHAGHFPHIEQPAETAGKVLDFVNHLPR